MKTIRSKTGARAFRKETRKAFRPMTLAFFLQDWEDAYNVGSMFRVADAVGASELILTGRTPMPPNPMVSVTSLGSHRRVPFRVMERYVEAAEKLKAEGFTLIAVEIAEGASNFQEFEYPDKCCFVLGNEAAGIPPVVMSLCDAAVYIPMAGKGRSLNVHVAGAVVAFEARLSRSPSSSSSFSDAG